MRLAPGPGERAYDHQAMDTTVVGPTDPLVGRLLDDRYRIDHVIARGGMATVYQATDTRLDRTVAVKVMHRALADDPDFVARFTREARAAARLSTPEVVAVHDQGTDPETGLAYLVMEHVRGTTLRHLLEQRGGLSPARAVSLLEPVLVALAAAHAAGLVHRDVKPENVLLGDDGRVKVADFGLARAVETSTLTATTGLLIGTVAYLAPEQVESGRADARSDVYAAGILLFELLTGDPPYVGQTPLSVAFQHLHSDVPAPSSVVEGVPAALDALVVRATRRDPARRPADAGAFLEELRAVQHDLPVEPALRRSTPRPTEVVALSVAEAPRPRRRHRRGLLALLVLLLLAGAALGGGYYLGTGRYTHAPSVLELTRPQAQARLAAAGLTVRVGASRHDERIATGLVLSQQPAPNARLRKDAAVTVILSSGPDRRVVPTVVGTAQSMATSALHQADLVLGQVSRAYSSSVPAGDVLSSDPAAGARLKPGTAVALVVSRGVQQVSVPDVRGLSRGDAVALVQRTGLRASTLDVFSDTVPAGAVVDQAPLGGLAPLGSTVALQVSKGPDVVEVPDVRGDRPGTAERKLSEAGLVGVRVDGPFSTGSVVYNTDPGPGSRVRRGSRVRFFVV